MPHRPLPARPRRLLAAGLIPIALASTALPVLTSPASANPAGTGLVISEVYVNGGSAGAIYTNKFIELYNPTNAAISLSGLSLQYRSATGTGNASNVAVLSGSVPATGYFVVKGGSNGSNGSALPSSNLDATGINPAGGGGTLFLTTGTTATTPAGAIDAVGWGTSNAPEGAAATGNSVTASLQRSASGADTDNNSADFAAAVPTPGAGTAGGGTGGGTGGGSGGGTGGGSTTLTPIAEVQGTDTATSPKAGQTVTVRGVVTAAYPTGGYNGFYVQTIGTGGATDATPGASDAVFVYLGSLAASAYPALGDVVDVTGAVSEFQGTTEISPTAASDIVKPSGVTGTVTSLAAAYPTTEAGREAHEGELLAPTDTFTVTNSYSTNQYAEVGLATGTTPLIQPTDVARPGTAAATAIAADNAARGVVLDDGASINFLSSANQGTPVPYLTNTAGNAVPVRVGARATLTAPVVLEYRNSTWKFQPTAQLLATGTPPATFANTRTPAPEDVGGDLRLATFNVLNYFNTTGQAFVAAGGTCSYYNDRAGAPITDNTCNPDGPRGAATTASFQRQQAKIVAAINSLGADIVSLEEIENSIKLIGETDRDDALRSLVDALNSAAGSTVWAYAPSPAAADLPALAEQDVIRTGFIYKPARVALVGASKVLVGASAFDNAREPLAQAFKRVGTPDSSAFAVIVNHFKSKGSGGTGDNADTGDGQGFYNGDRVRQAQALTTFANQFATDRGISKVFLTGDFNSYTQEDPMQVLYNAGYSAVESTTTPGESTYSFSGLSGSLDHVLVNQAAKPTVTGADIWNINSGESVAFEYSRYNYNATDFYQANPYRSSDHDPEVVGISAPVANPAFDLTLLGVNDFHGRINANTVKWAGTVEQLRAAAPSADDTLFIGAGDLIGASEFASSTQKDQPTIDMFNALGLNASAVGNHEFDQGWVDLRDRVIGGTNGNARNALWDYLGANVYAKGTQNPVLPEYALYEKHGVKIAVVGAVTEETATLVSPGGISDITFGDPVAAVNRVATKLSDGAPSNGEADVIVATFHAGAVQGTGSNYAAEIAKGGEFAKMANISPDVDAIFNGHTHQVYAWDQPVGTAGRSRPLLQTGNYGDNVGKIVLKIDPTTKSVVSYSAANVARTTTSDADLVAAYPRVAKVKTIVDNALAYAAQVGNQPVGSITGDITTAYTNNGTTRDDRASESTLGDLVGNALRDGIPASLGGADLGIVNPGGLRAELTYAGNTSSNPANTNGVVTYAEANAVLPFINNVWIVRLTGAQLKAVLEQQWQPSGASRPFLALGLSDNVRVTQDPTKAVGSRITSIRINGEPIDPAATYRVSTFSFLGTGGDNFTAFTQGTSSDTGLVDRDLWIQYLRDHPNLSPDFARQQVVESGLPQAVTAGQSVSFSLAKLDLTSLGSPVNQRVRVFLAKGSESRAVGTFPVSNGATSIAFTAPADLAGTWQIGVAAEPSATRVGASGVVPAAPSVAGTVRTSAGAPASGACVYLYTSRTAPNASFATCTQSDGTYYVNVTAGTYEVAVTDPTGADDTTWRSTPLTVTGPTSGVDLTLKAPARARISGTVTEAGAATTTPLQDICVYAYQRSVSNAAAYGSCSIVDGTYGLYGMAAGTYDLAFFDPTGGHRTQWWTGTATGAPSQSGATGIALTTGTSATVANAAMEALGGVVTGTVRAAGNPVGLNKVCVYLYADAAGPAKYGTCTQSDGTFYFSGVKAGVDYKVAFAAPDGTLLTQWWTGTAGGAPSYAAGTTIGVVRDGGRISGIDAAMAGTASS